MEIFKDIEGYEGRYEISDLGRVFSLNSRGRHGRKELKRGINKMGYYQIGLCKDGPKQKYFLVHRLVAKHFIPNPENKPEVNHIDGDKLNCHKDNLEWSTRKENAIHAHRNGLQIIKKGTEHHMYGRKKVGNKYLIICE